MRTALLAASLVFASACGGRNPGPCCEPRTARNFGYTGSYVADGGVSTQVQLIMTSSGEVQLSLIREGNVFTQTFASTRISR